ncbi:hypothetical protein K435DRAFT_878010 [Dendrothele bispora CBS 962.96]|uniref:Myb/SANT-like domain-containing protein n=1 Tax=Dendrothele bispora (strain CBS 962.96) TaxID=1314807 RepID=A0A4S8KNX8_DENBC|nr:hypothetical protein K435DRAFT_878010 [Dendrothele bispora CBS 962.96]
MSKKHSLFRAFAAAFSDTLLIPDKSDKKIVEAALAKRNLTWKVMRGRAPQWLWIETFTSPETWQKSKAVLEEVRKGWLSDPDGIPLYTLEGYDKNGLAKYHCLWGTNSVEGAIHNPIRRNFASLRASPELADALIADFRHWHNINCATKHKWGVTYRGHFNPWLDHNIAKLREVIVWSEKPKINIWSQALDTDPLSFATTEKFGIAAIPIDLQRENNYFPNQTLPKKDVNDLALSRLSGASRNVYPFLAQVQQTLYPVIPVHTKEECDLFQSAVKTGGKFSPRNGVPDFKSMTSWWTSQADGRKIFYKLFEHFETYYKTYKEYNNTKQSLVASQQQRKPHEDRIKSTLYVSQTLDAATRLHPGILNDPEHLLVDSAGLRHMPQEPYCTEITPASATFLTNDNEILEPFSKRQKLNHMFGVTENEQSLFSNATFAQPKMVMPLQLPAPAPFIMHPASYPNTSSSSVNQGSSLNNKTPDTATTEPKTVEKPKAPRPRAIYSDADNKKLMEVFLEHKQEGNGTDNGGWKSKAITAALAALTGSELESGGAPKSATSIRDHWDNLKRDFNNISTLLEKSGCGWDDENQCVQADVEQWEALAQARESHSLLRGSLGNRPY